MNINIDRMTEAQLYDLNRKVVERLKFLRSMRAHAAMLEFSIGEKVCFQSSKQGFVVGILTKYNKKTVTLITEDGDRWNVSPHLLHRLEENDNKATESAEIIDFVLK